MPGDYRGDLTNVTGVCGNCGSTLLDGVKYLEAEERKQAMPSLFDLVEPEQLAS